ncbi:UDP-2-acetamido-2,6-beta-L-arabino-hexul-4-ose reductase [Qipengyuania sp. DGS5-3]|uniref:UDP-2-acetamido-2,6-beta-L-arabino-hexul-4-ose reductase n=1 Tax=Qipengyuania sp. DGS5-3 TaxID=3349632 RepID=UPI0036D3390D
MNGVTRKVLVTGANGFVGKNLTVHLLEQEGVEIVPFTRDNAPDELERLVGEADAVVHLAGENRPEDDSAFDAVNHQLTRHLCEAMRTQWCDHQRKPTMIYASSAQAELDNLYGKSKLAGERAVEALAKETEIPCIVFRFTGIFGKWCKPGYNSVVATFCHNIARDIPLRIDDPAAALELVYIDDVVSAIQTALDGPKDGYQLREVTPVYRTSVGALAEHIYGFAHGRRTLHVGRVGEGFQRALYATFINALPQEQFSYSIPAHRDPRGVFVEMLKTPDVGQFSFLTALPGVTRGGHYHHTKTEKFLVIRGKASFGFRHLLTGERLELVTEGDQPQVVQTIPGWSHDITNIGSEELIVMLWANEIFDRQRPDTVVSEV